MSRARPWLRLAAVVSVLAVAMAPMPLRAEKVSGSTKASGSKKVAWQVEPYWRPVAGLSSYSTPSGTYVGVRMGGTAGVHYWKAPWLGRTRVLGSWTTGSNDVSGLELRLGTFMGPHKEYWGVEGGLDLFWDRVTANNIELLPASGGIDIPVNLHLGPQQFYGLVGVTPAVLFSPERRVDWSETDAFGFGHEFAWQLGAGARLSRFGAALVYSHRVVVSGVHSGWSLSLSL